jgi:3'(2'), 5'-bisphosphate nucleotidase
MSSADLAVAFYPDVLRLAFAAGDEIMGVYHNDFAIEKKGDQSPLTAADLKAHEVLVHGLRRLKPELPVLSEEGALTPWSERGAWERYWLVDPLDGTREFVKRNGEFTVNVALIDRGEPILGVIHAPALGESYFGIATVGAFASRSHNPWHRLTARRPAADPPRVLASRSHSDARLERVLSRLAPHERLGLGSSLKFARIATGQADLYIRLGPTCEWDTAAGHCLLAASGGQVTTLAREPLVYNQKSSLKNPFFIAFADPGIVPDRLEETAGSGGG